MDAKVQKDAADGDLGELVADLDVEGTPHPARPECHIPAHRTNNRWPS